MKIWLRLAAAALLTVVIGLILVGAVGAQPANPEAAAAADPFCDYCKDFTDAATASEPPRSAYRPGVGYAAEPRKGAVIEAPRPIEEPGLRLLGSPARADTK
jgi:hypothetical protein